MATVTPMMQQYLELKRENPDCLLFFRLGDFYEMFFEDAVTCSRELELGENQRSWFGRHRRRVKIPKLVWDFPRRRPALCFCEAKALSSPAMIALLEIVFEFDISTIWMVGSVVVIAESMAIGVAFGIPLKVDDTMTHIALGDSVIVFDDVRNEVEGHIQHIVLIGNTIAGGLLDSGLTVYIKLHIFNIHFGKMTESSKFSGVKLS